MEYLLVILLPLLLVSCRKEEVPIFRTDKLDGEKEMLVGTWKSWRETNSVYFPISFYANLNYDPDLKLDGFIGGDTLVLRGAYINEPFWCEEFDHGWDCCAVLNYFVRK